MIELHPADYHKSVKPLQSVTINTLFAESVIRQHIRGMVYVDSVVSPMTFYIKHPYGMSLLFGKTENREFNESLYHYLINSKERRQSEELLQVYPEDWYERLENLLGKSLLKMSKGQAFQKKTATGRNHQVQQYERINFSFKYGSYYQNKKQSTGIRYPIEVIDKEIFEQFTGQVAPINFWNSAEDFLAQAKGYCLMVDQKVASVAFASFIIGNKIEIGVETKPEYRGEGFATIVCSALIDDCLEKDCLPVWSCHAGNIDSIRLANRLGFKAGRTIPYYRLVC